VRYRSPASYLSRSRQLGFVAENVEVLRDELPFEFMLNAMRLVEGVPARWFGERTGLGPSVIDAPLREAQRRGLMTADHEVWKPTPLGARFLNDLQTLFLPG
ncbi:MAG TPA: oxygen-independent coproporphyrinogen III oxidase-like protein, partial [Burkholderiaceae bacterium]|nr:oxygen-independent coproporphyrinogen III oxidase-like protein [Burkholderiaceae bacterium]